MFLHNLLNVLVQIVNKMGLQKKIEEFLEAVFSMRLAPKFIPYREGNIRADSHHKQYGLLQIRHKRGWTKVTYAIQGPTCYPIDKANIIVYFLENQFRLHDFCDCGHERHVNAQVTALLATVDVDIPVNFRTCDASNEIQSLISGNACGS
jgi:hypothetical protein